MDESQTQDLMTIGEFARLGQLSLKALRLYDTMGLLKPTTVDQDSGYRYYLPAQASKARLIGLLRRLEMPLERIALILELEDGDAARAIATYWHEVEADLQTRRKLVQYLQNHLQGKGGQMFEIQERTIPEQKVATIQSRTLAANLPDFISSSMHELLDHLATSGLTPTAPVFVAYHGQVDTDSDGPVETCVPFEGQLEPTDNIRIRLEPSHSEYYTRITKAQVEFPSILEAYSAVNRAITDSGKVAAGSPREVYFADWGKLQADDLACDIARPYRD